MKDTALENYLVEHCSLENSPAKDALGWLERQTHIRTNYPRMLSGKVQGSLLKLLAELCGAQRALEIGTFTGYSAICIALGLGPQGHLDALEINDELEDLILEGWQKAGVSERISLHIGDATRTIQSLNLAPGSLDFVFIDANKREYREYYELVLPLVRQGGLIIADDVLWDGKVYAEHPDVDKQTQSLIAFNDFVATDPRVSCVTVPLRDGLTLMRKL